MSDKIQENWPQIIKNLVQDYKITNIAYKTWIAKLAVYSVSGHDVTLLVDDSIAQLVQYVKSKYEKPLEVTISEYFDDEYTVHIVNRSQLSASMEADTAAAPAAPSAGVIMNDLNNNLNPAYTFDTFVVGKNNDLAQATALAVASDPGVYGNPLFIYGGVGLGKTHLMQSIAHYVLSERPDYRIIYTSAETFQREFIAAIKNKTQESFKNKYRNIDMLLIDDVQFISGRDSTMEEFFHTFNALYDRKRQIVISSDKPPKDLVGIEERLISRFKVGITVDIQPPDYDTRVAILSKKADLEHINIDESSLHYIAEHVVSNIRELEGALNKISNYMRLKKCSYADEDLTKEVLKDVIAPDEKKPITPEIIINTVVEHYHNKISAADILGKNRSRDISYPRQICMYLCEKYTGLSYAAIGEALGNKDHTTVLHGVKKIKKELETDPQLKSSIEVIIKKLDPPR